MKNKICLSLLLAWVLIPFMATADQPAGKDKPADSVACFCLKDTTGKEVSLCNYRDKKAVVVVFIGTECPVNNYFMLRLKELHEEFASKGVQLLAVNSNVQDSPEKVAEHAKEHKLPFPVLKDPDNKVADLFKAERTPEAFLLDDKDGVRYRGRIDDQYGVGYQRPKPNRRDLAEAITELLAGKPVTKSRTEVSGCIIGRTKVSRVASAPGVQPITFTNQVSRILQKNCQECHRPGQIGPFSLMTYEKARGWADTIREVVTDGRMPPWHADPKHGNFSNDRRLSKEDKGTLLTWIDQGCPKGDDKDLPQPKQWFEGWAIGKPDAVFTMLEPFKVPAKAGKNGVPYKYFQIPTNFKEDMWIQAAEAKPGNRSIVHHIIVFHMNPGEVLRPRENRTPEERERQSRGREDRIGNNFMCGTAPGDMPLILRPGMAKRIPKGAVLVFQMHYTPNGIEQTDASSVGFIFAKEPPKQIARTRTVMQPRIAIPPGDGNYEVISQSTFEKDIMLLSFMPHMHVRGKDFKYEVTYPDGRTETLLSVPRYDFGWQSTYRLVEPMKLPAGTKMVCTAHFDNSTDNPNNPDPTKTVYWGDQTWEEMMIGWLDYYYLDEKPGSIASDKKDTE